MSFLRSFMDHSVSGCYTASIKDSAHVSALCHDMSCADFQKQKREKLNSLEKQRGHLHINS